MNLAVELVLMHIVDELGGKVTFREILERTEMTPKLLRKHLWYCQRKKFLRRDIGVYYLTQLGKSLLDKNVIVKFNGKIYAIKLADKIYLITIGRKMRVRSVKIENVKSILSINCVNKESLKSLGPRDSFLDAIRLLKLLGAVYYRGDKICFELRNLEDMHLLGLF